MGNFNKLKVYIRLLLLFENAQKLNSEAISLTENLTKPHPHRLCIQVKKTTFRFIMALIEVKDTGLNSLSHCRNRVWLPIVSKKKSKKNHTLLLKHAEAESSFSLPPANCVCFSPLTCLGYSLRQSLD